MTEKSYKNFKMSTKCWTYKKKQYGKDDAIVKYHCHIIGIYQGSTHKECNLNLCQKSPCSIS